MPKRVVYAAALAAWVSAAASETALHLMFPYDYLSMSDDERRLYVLGVVDTHLAPLEQSARLDWLTRCLTQEGITRVQHVLETELIPSPETAVIPMPYVVERALQMVCKGYAKSRQ